MVVVKGVIVSEPSFATDKTSFVIESSEIKHNNTSCNVSGKVFIRCKGEADFSYGDEVIIYGGLYKPYNYFKRRLAYLMLSVSGRSNIEKVGCLKLNLLEATIAYLKLKIEKIFSTQVEPRCAQLLCALILGEREKVPSIVRESMIHTGTWHIMVVSGSHTALVALILLIFFKMARVPRNIRFCLTTALLIVYCILTGASSPVVRSTVMTGIFLAGFLIERKPHFYNSLAIACLAILIFDPVQLFDIGFQLSFVSVFFIVWLPPKIKKLFPEKSSQGCILSYTTTCFCVSFSAWLGTAPLIAHTFGNFSSISVLANIVVVPLAMLVMTTGFALVAVGSFFPFFAMPLGHANEFFMFLLIKINFLLERLPFAFLNFPPIPLLFVIGYYILLFLLVTTLERSEASLTRLG